MVHTTRQPSELRQTLATASVILATAVAALVFVALTHTRADAAADPLVFVQEVKGHPEPGGPYVVDGFALGFAATFSAPFLLVEADGRLGDAVQGNVPVANQILASDDVGVWDKNRRRFVRTGNAIVSDGTLPSPGGGLYPGSAAGDGGQLAGAYNRTQPDRLHFRATSGAQPTWSNEVTIASGTSNFERVALDDGNGIAAVAWTDPSLPEWQSNLAILGRVGDHWSVTQRLIVPVVENLILDDGRLFMKNGLGSPRISWYSANANGTVSLTDEWYGPLGRRIELHDAKDGRVLAGTTSQNNQSVIHVLETRTNELTGSTTITPPRLSIYGASFQGDDVLVSGYHGTAPDYGWVRRYTSEAIDIGDCTIVGTSGRDTLIGTSGDDVICGFGGDDVIRGNGGNDVLRGGAGADDIEGGDGDDIIDGGEGNDTLRGGGNDDTIRGGLGDDIVNGWRGNDTLSGGDGRDTMDGGDGADDLEGGDGDDKVHGGPGDDTVRGGGGNDEVSGGSGDDRVTGWTGYDKLYGGEGDDTLLGGDHNDTLVGGPGADTLRGQAGDDELRGEAGRDTLYGGHGNDYLLGGTEDDLLLGEQGGDRIYGEGGNDEAWGGPGNDEVVGADGNDTLGGGPGYDSIYGNAGGDTLYAGDGGGRLDGGAATDVCVGGTKVNCER